MMSGRSPWRRSPRRWLPIAFALLGAASLPVAALAQAGDAFPEAAEAAPQRGGMPCRGETVREIVVLSSAPTVAGLHKLPFLADLARAAHSTTVPSVVRGFLLFREGEACTELARAESERLLRAQPFIADATVDAFPVGDGVRIEVRTVDEGAIVFGARVLSGQPLVRSLRVGNGNVAGRGVYLATDWRAGGVLRDGAGFTFTDHQLVGMPYVLHLQARRAPLGGEWHGALTRPFYTGLQRQAWRAGGGEVTAYADLQHPDSATHAVRIARRYADAGIMGRVGSPVRMVLFGGLLSHEREVSAPDLLAFDQGGVPHPSGTVLPATAYSSTRANAFVGVRSLAFVRVTGFDALSATQDVPVGYQAGLVVGRGIGRPAPGSGRELFSAADVYAGWGGPEAATRLQLRAQGARAAEDGAWGRVVTTGRLAHQRKPSSGRTVEVSADWAGAWRPGLPMQLLLGAHDGGVRGYEHSREGGGRRARIRVEDRRLLGAFGTKGMLGDVGVAAFAEAGRVWRGDAPLGVTTPLRPAIGASLLAAVPAHSARLWRLDIAMPLQGANAGRLEIGFSNRDHTSVFWRESADIAPMRGRTVPSSVFAWP